MQASPPASDPGTGAGGGAPGLYVHVPFCARRCRYCDFYSTTDPARVDAWLDGVRAEAGRHRGRWEPFGTLYIGGGTPSLLPLPALAQLIQALRERLTFAEGAEVTLEVNPDDVTREGARNWSDLGIGRASVGVQSFDDTVLRFLGRRHDARGAVEAVDRLRSAGFQDLGLDLLFGVPGMDAGLWRATLERALDQAPEHLSCYELTIEEGTPLGRAAADGIVELPGEETGRARFLEAHGILEEAGFDHYEVSNYARGPGHRSRHNTRYWRHVPYLGLGPSAHSFDGTHRWWNPRSLASWSRALAEGVDPAEARERITADQRRLEAVMLGLRTSSGVGLEALGPITVEVQRALDELVVERLVRIEGERVRPTVEGMLVSDGLPLRILD